MVAMAVPVSMAAWRRSRGRGVSRWVLEWDGIG